MDHLEGHGVHTHLVVLLRNVCANQKAAVKTECGRDGTVQHRERCATGLHPVSFVNKHLH